jgi:hypothetical protein
MYVALFLLGMFLCGYANFMSGETLTDFLTRLILLISGFICILFAAVTYDLREDPDIWR